MALKYSPTAERFRRMNKAMALNEAAKVEALKADDEKEMKKEGMDHIHSNLSLRNRFRQVKEDAVNKLAGNLFKEELFTIFCEAVPLKIDFKRSKRNALLKLFNTVLEDTLYEIDKGSLDISSPDVVAMLSKKDDPSKAGDIYGVCRNCAQDQIDMDLYRSTGSTPAEMPNDIKGMNYVLSEKPKLAEAKSDLDPELASDFDKVNEEDRKNISDIVSDKVIDSVAQEKEKAEKAKDDNKEIEESLPEEEKEDEADSAPDEGDAMDSSSTEDEPDSSDDDDDDKDDSSDDDDDKNDQSDDDDKDDSSDDDDDDKKEEPKKEEKPVKGAKTPEVKEEDEPNKVEESFVPITLRNIVRAQDRVLSETSLFKTIHMAVLKKHLSENKALSEDTTVSVNVDNVFKEAVCYQTLLEMFNTIKLIQGDTLEQKKYALRVISRI